MKHLLTKGAVMAVVAIIINTVLCTGLAQAWFSDPNDPNWPAPNWPEIFKPNQLLTLNLEMDPCDWHDVINNTPEPDGCIYTHVELPAWFWMDGEEDLKIVVEVRRKKSVAFPDETDPCKVALKIDINQYFDEDPNAVSHWHGLKKLSLEVNIDSMDIISEGVACNIHQMAAGLGGHDTFYANWVKLYVNGNYIGIYVNNEQRDKQFLRNRGIYVGHGLTWLYKYADCVTSFILKVGDDDFPRSPALEALCYAPFVNNDITYRPTGGICSVPNDVTVIADMEQWVDMQRMLTMAATDAFLANSGCLFQNSENTYFHDFNLADPCETRKRMYFPWDVDQGFKSFDWDIYYTDATYEYKEVILGKPVFRSQYSQIMRDLLDGPFSFADINDFLDMVEPVITSAVEADPLAMAHIFDIWGASSAAECFDAIRSWFAQRIPNVLAQVEFDDPTPPPGIILLQDGFEGAVWDANWTGTWVEDTSTYAHGSSSAHAYKDNYGDFNCVALDTSDAATVHVDFWLRMNNIVGSYNPKLYYYNGTSYVDVCDLDTFGPDDVWLHYTDTITDSNYFIPNFQIQFSATLGGGGPGRDVWVDDVTITKELPEGTPCDAANLDGAGLVNFEDYVILANDWRLTGSSLAGDIDANDVVNFGDLDWMFEYWLNDCN